MKEYVILKEIKDLEYEDAYKAMFNFMYGLKYDDGILRNDIGFHFDVYRVASEYEVGELQKLAFEKVKKIADKDAWDVEQFVKILKKKLVHDEKLYEFLIDTCHKYIAELVNEYGFEEAMEVNHPIATGLVLSWGDHQLQYCCPQCEKVWPMDTLFLSIPSFCPNCGHREDTCAPNEYSASRPAR